MTVLNREQIKDEIEGGHLVISPLLSNKQQGIASIDLRMGNIVLLSRARGLSHVNPQEYVGADDDHRTQVGKRQKHERHELTFEQSFLLHPGTLALVPTLEWLRLPMNLQGFVTARSSWAREGLNIATASFIEPGYEGIITLELANLGQIPIALYPGLRLAQIAFNYVEPPAERYLDEHTQFQMSFEPRGGDIAKHDEMFLPPKVQTSEAIDQIELVLRERTAGIDEKLVNNAREALGKLIEALAAHKAGGGQKS